LLHKIASKERPSPSRPRPSGQFYPTAVIVVAFIVTAILLIFVIPQFESLFKGFGADLPAFTKLVIGLSRVFQDWWWAIFGAMGAAAYGFYEARRRSRKFAHFLDRASLKIPIVGVILNKAAIARYARTLSTMFAAGVPLVEAMESVAGATETSSIPTRCSACATRWPRPTTATRDADEQPFPNMVVQMVAIGRSPGRLRACSRR
jgi:type IV pilus assembly protein PilC